MNDELTDNQRPASVHRRGFLRGSGVVGLGLALTTLVACGPQQQATPAPTQPAPTQPGTGTQPGATTQPGETQPPAKPKATQRARITYITDVAEFALMMAGAERGTYAEAGIEPQFVPIRDGGTQLRSLLANEVDLMIGGVGTVFAAQAQGADARVVGSAYPKLNFVMYARPEIKAVTDLAGKSVGTASPGSLLHSIATVLLKDNGVDLNRVQFVNIGSSPAVFLAVQEGKVDAGPSTIDYIPVAQQQQNPVVIADFARELPDYFRLAIIASGQSVRDRPELVRSGLEGIVRSQRFAIENKQAVVDFGVNQMGKDRAQMEFLHDYEVNNRIIAPNAEVERQWVQVTQQIQVDSGTQPRVVPFEDTTDLRFQQQVIERLGRYEWK